MCAFRIAKSVEVPNYKFDTPQYCTFIMAGSTIIPAGRSFLAFTQVSPPYDTAGYAVNLLNILKRGDVIIGVSSHDDYSGQSEHLIVDKVLYTGGAHLVYFQVNTTLGYVSGDKFAGYGTGWPSGWVTNSENFNKYRNSSIMPPSSGYNSDYCFRTTVRYNSAKPYPDRGMFETYWDETPFLPACYYRFGVFVKQELQEHGIEKTSGGSIYFAIEDGGYNPLTDSTDNQHGYLFTNYDAPAQAWDFYTWHEFNFVFRSFHNIHANSAYRARLLMELRTGYDVDEGGDSQYWLAKPYVEHIRGIANCSELIEDTQLEGGVFAEQFKVADITQFSVSDIVNVSGMNITGTSFLSYEALVVARDTTTNTIKLGFLNLPQSTSSVNWAAGARIEVKNDGYYELPEPPDLPVNWNIENSVQSSRTANNKLLYFNNSPWGARSKKKTITLQYSNVAYTMLQTLRKFEDYCLEGGLVNMHWDQSDIYEWGDDYLRGIITITGANRVIWNPQLCNFTLNIIEA